MSYLCSTLFVIAAFLFYSHAVYACMWGPPYRTVCEKYARAEMVVTGKIKSVERGPSTQKVVVAIDKTFKGKSQSKITLYQPVSTCDWDFVGEEGKRVLLYLVRHTETGEYRNDSPGAGGLIEQSNEELYWLRGLPRSMDRTRIAGTVDLFKAEPFEFIESVGGVRVKVSSKDRSYETRTDKNGVYEVWDLPRAEYTILPVFPPKTIFDLVLSKGDIEFRQVSEDRVDIDNFKVKLTDIRCGGADFVLNPN